VASGKIVICIVLTLFIAPAIFLALSFPTDAQATGGTTVKRYKDREEDVISDEAKRALDRFVDIEELEGEKDNDFDERKYMDIISLSIIENDTYISFSLLTFGGIRVQKEYTYTVAGYARKDFRSTEPFDFILSFSAGNATYMRWSDGSFRTEDNISSVEVQGNALNLTMNRGRFVVASRTTPLFATAIAVLETGAGKARRIDHVETRKLEDGGSKRLDDTTIIMIQLAVFGFIFLAIMVLWNVWARKKGMDQSGGVCPKCESKLDSKLEFCPSCGSYVKGPISDGAGVKPRIVELPKDPPEKEE
jgi:hypothetical protein